jgi:hypothetical protein
MARNGDILMFEYKIVEFDKEAEIKRMNELGREGWELVSLFPVRYTTQAREKAVFKRELNG